MSHSPERKEKNCLNCNAQVAGKFCQVCGQENIEVKETAWQLITHFFYDITHFDGKFFSTLKYLVARPGFISLEYVRGRRLAYLNPIRMYIFTSAIFFLIFFSIFKVDNSVNINSKFNDKAVDAMDSASLADFAEEYNNGKPLDKQEIKKRLDTINLKSGLHFTRTEYNSKAEYDSLLALGKKQHNWLQRQLIYREIALNDKYNKDTSQILKAFIAQLVHTFPQILFISLPLFALMLKMLYHRNKKFYYANHLIFTFHLYIFVFIMLLLIIGITQLKTAVHLQTLNWIIGIIYLSLFYYEYRAMRNFYAQNRWKTLFKFILLNFLHLFIIMFLFIIFTFFSFLNI